MSPFGNMAWETHTKPGNGHECVACRYTVKGNEIHAQRLYCDPQGGGCGHYHRGPCPEIAPNEQEAQNA